MLTICSSDCRLTDNYNSIMKYYLFFAIALGFILGCGPKENPNEITASGTIEAIDVNVAAKVPAQITTLYIDDGTPVDSGSLIAAQDRSELDIQLREAQSALDNARAQQ